MKPMAYNRNKYSGEYYKLVSTNVGDTLTNKYYFVKNLSLTAGVTVQGKLTIKTDEPVPIGSLIANIKDVNGNLILDDIIWQVSGIQPALNAFNTVESYRLAAVKFQGTI